MNLDAVGIQSITVSNVENSNLKKSVSVSTPVRASTGGFHAAEAFNPVFDGSIKAKGDLPAAFLLGSDGDLTVAGITGGKTMILDLEEMEKNDDHNGYSITYRNRPGA